ncbi:MAG: putative zinc-binding metallopeptidase [Polyangiales bacterium]
MRSFACTHCGQLLFFENSHCLRCGAGLGFVPERLSLCVIEGSTSRGYYVDRADSSDSHRREGQEGADRSDASRRPRPFYKRCARAQLAACNWLVPEGDEELCESCRLTATAPKLRHDADLHAFAKAEGAKRRLIYQLLDLGLPIVSRQQDPIHGLAFVLAFRSDDDAFLTGHSDGLISVDLSECDNAHREHLREVFGEPYRTLLGHFRHEIGHYFWNALIAGSPALGAFRERFGDERADYAAALDRNYNGPTQVDWSQRHVSSYAASHPWEDWAETFAHYLHIRDTLQTAAHFGLHVSPRAPTIPPAGGKLSARATEEIAQRDFAAVIAEWLPLTYAFNAANRSMGKEDLYPFVLAPRVIEKLAFVHDLVRDVADAQRLAQAMRMAGKSRLEPNVPATPPTGFSIAESLAELDEVESLAPELAGSLATELELLDPDPFPAPLPRTPLGDTSRSDPRIEVTRSSDPARGSDPYVDASGQAPRQPLESGGPSNDPSQGEPASGTGPKVGTATAA